MTNQTIEIGTKVQITFPWAETEQPGDTNFLSGTVAEIVERSVYAVYVRLEGIERLFPIDRAITV